MEINREPWSFHYRRSIKKKKINFYVISETAINPGGYLTSFRRIFMHCAFASECLYKDSTPSTAWFRCHWSREDLPCAWVTLIWASPWKVEHAFYWGWQGDSLFFIEECYSKLLLDKTSLKSPKWRPKTGLEVLPSHVPGYTFDTQDTIY